MKEGKYYYSSSSMLKIEMLPDDDRYRHITLNNVDICVFPSLERFVLSSVLEGALKDANKYEKMCECLFKMVVLKNNKTALTNDVVWDLVCFIVNDKNPINVCFDEIKNTKILHAKNNEYCLAYLCGSSVRHVFFTENEEREFYDILKEDRLFCKKEISQWCFDVLLKKKCIPQNELQYLIDAFKKDHAFTRKYEFTICLLEPLKLIFYVFPMFVFFKGLYENDIVIVSLTLIATFISIVFFVLLRCLKDI